MKKLLHIISLLIVVALGFGCAKSKESPEIAANPPKPGFLRKELDKVLSLTTHAYNSYGQRNPFVSLIKERSRMASLRETQSKSRAEEETKRREFISRFTLTGLAWDEKEACALIKKENVSYILKRGELLDENYKPVPGIGGEVIDGESAILFSRGEKFYLSLEKE